MATPGELVHVMAGVLGVSGATITQYDRVLAENGLRSKSGRGRSAAKVTSRDAVNLLIAVATSPLFGSSAKDAVRNCKVYGSMPIVAPRSSKNFSQLGLPILDSFPQEHSFGDALSALIDAVGEGEDFRPPDHFFEVQFLGPDPSAQIFGDSSRGIDPVARLIYHGARKRRPRSAPIIFGDLRQISSIGFGTICAVGSLITGGTAWQGELMSRRFMRVEDSLASKRAAQGKAPSDLAKHPKRVRSNREG
jgi:hypothetical protein